MKQHLDGVLLGIVEQGGHVVVLALFAQKPLVQTPTFLRAVARLVDVIYTIFSIQTIFN